MKTRKEAVALINKQFDEEKLKESGCWHYGRVELRALLDLIYEGEPTSDDEKIMQFKNVKNK